MTYIQLIQTIMSERDLKTSKSMKSMKSNDSTMSPSKSSGSKPVSSENTLSLPDIGLNTGTIRPSKGTPDSSKKALLEHVPMVSYRDFICQLITTTVM